MKTKNVVLGLLACIVAMGSAFVSLTAPITLYVRAYTSQSNFEEGIVTCVNTGETCNEVPSGISCGVTIETSYGWINTADTRKDRQCVQYTVTRSQGMLPISTIWVYALDD